ncbi:hypothetical protein [Enterococcus faecalis]|uniref:Uncharacterized protein n=1 Tax=Enterococcus faecalis ATCC 6055 TaxID=1169311 RepID=R3HMG5_ENTFL|nr:hypothetical protein [Enterococcus faecalis]EOK06762.1 hypothetical protein WOU_03135 [Enterococcus faecalis ATCC 6055]
MDKEKLARELNERYFISFAHSRGSISMLKVSLAGLIISLINIYPSYIINKTVDNINPWENYLNIGLAFVALSMLIFMVLSIFSKFLYKKQILSGIFLVIMTTYLEFTIIYLSYIIAVFTSYSLNLNSLKSYTFIVAICSMLILSLIYNILWLKRQLKEGFKEERSQKNLQAKNAVYNSKSLWIIFGLTSIGGIVLGQIRFLFGFGLGVLIVIAFSRLIVEITYLTYLKSKDKKYWEEPPKPTPIKELNEEEKKERKKKQIKIINISASFGFLLFIGWLVERVEIIGVMKTILRGITMLVLLNLLVTCLLWFGSKVKKYLRKEK